MNEQNRTIDGSLESRIAALQQEKVSNMTLGEISGKIKELESLERAADMVARRAVDTAANYNEAQNTRQNATQELKRYDDINPVRYNTVSTVDGRFQQSACGNKPGRVGRLSEQNVGRYVMTALAAILCLLAFSVLIMTFWEQLPDFGKFAVFLVSGAGLGFLGAWKAKDSPIRPFWLGIAGVGSGICFIDLTAGSQIWQLYGVVVAGIFTIIWFLGNMWLGKNQPAGLFYVIAFVGGLLAVEMASGTLDYTSSADIAGELTLMLLSTVVFITGYIQFIREKKQYLLILDIVFCIISATIMNSLQYFNDLGLTNTASYSPILLPWFCLILLTVCLYVSKDINTELRGFRTIQKAILILCVCLPLCEASRFAFQNSSNVACLLALVVMVLPSISNSYGYALGVSIPIFEVLSIFSANLTGSIPTNGAFLCSALLPSVAFAAVTLVPKPYERWDTRLAIVLAYITTFCELAANGYEANNAAFFTVSAVMILFGVCAYFYRAWKEQTWFKKEYDLLALLLLPGLTIQPIFDWECFHRFYLLGFAVMMAGIYAYYFICLRKEEKIRFFGILWYAAKTIVYAFIWFGMWYDTIVDDIIFSVIMIVSISYNIYRSLYSKSTFHSVMTGIFVNFNMLTLAAVWNFSKYDMLVSLIGLGIAGGFIALGFRFKVKSLRQVGLVCAVLYSIKMGLFDIGGNSGLGAAGGLLLAGLLCFGISLAYNKLGKVYGEDEQIQSEDLTETLVESTAVSAEIKQNETEN